MKARKILHIIGIHSFDLIKRRKTYQFIREGEKAVNYDESRLREIQFRKLKKLLIHAYENVPFYRKRMDGYQFDPYHIRSFDELNKIPTLTRYDLQNHWETIIAKNYNKNNLTKGSSSGSTGTPVIYYKDAVGSSAGQAANYIGMGFSGYKFGMKGLHIWGNPTTVNNEWKRPSSKLKAKVFSHHKYPAYKLTEQKRFDELVSLIKKKHYEFIDGYTNAIYLLANYIKENNIFFPKVHLVYTTGENLMEYQREVIEKFLGPVYDMYGCAEVNGIANQCPYCNSYHTLDHHVFVEYGDFADDVLRKLIVTDLDNYGFPLIRYENGDLIQKTEKEKICHISFGAFDKVIGRQSDIIEMPKGGYLSVPSFFGSMLLKKIDGIKHYQVVREKRNFLKIRFELNRPLNDNEMKLIKESLNDYIGNQMKWEIDTKSKIEVENNGKFKLVIDKIKQW